jgi:hypothetical protein
VAVSNWRPIAEAERGIGPLLLRCGAGPTDPAFVGYQDPDNGLWYFGDHQEVRPLYFAKIPEFDFDGGAAA